MYVHTDTAHKITLDTFNFYFENAEADVLSLQRETTYMVFYECYITDPAIPLYKCQVIPGRRIPLLVNNKRVKAYVIKRFI